MFRCYPDLEIPLLRSSKVRDSSMNCRYIPRTRRFTVLLIGVLKSKHYSVQFITYAYGDHFQSVLDGLTNSFIQSLNGVSIETID